jgi:hypothetical protein
MYRICFGYWSQLFDALHRVVKVRSIGLLCVPKTLFELMP